MKSNACIRLGKVGIILLASFFAGGGGAGERADILLASRGGGHAEGEWLQAAVTPLAAKGDMLTLAKLLRAAAATYPSLAASRMQAQAAKQDVVVAERQRWPTVSVTAESDTGNASFQPGRLLQVEQVLWDFGRNGARIEEAEKQSVVADALAEEQAQQVFLSVVGAWQSLLDADERTKVAARTKELLLNFRKQMRRRVNAQASPVIDLELVESRLLQTEVELGAAETTVRTAVLRLARLTGLLDIGERLAFIEPMPSLELADRVISTFSEGDTDALAELSPAVIKAQGDIEAERARLRAKKAEGWPQLYARIAQPLGKTKYSGNADAIAFVGVRYTPGAGFSQLAEVDALEFRLAGLEQSVIAARHEAVEFLRSDLEELINSRKRIDSLIGAVEGAARVLDSSRRQFQAGRKSWLDLLNAVRELAQNEYGLATARSSLVGAMQRLAVRTGRNPF